MDTLTGIDHSRTGDSRAKTPPPRRNLRLSFPVIRRIGEEINTACRLERQP